jgi:hypothetical protein
VIPRSLAIALLLLVAGHTSSPAMAASAAIRKASQVEDYARRINELEPMVLKLPAGPSRNIAQRILIDIRCWLSDIRGLTELRRDGQQNFQLAILCAVTRGSMADLERRVRGGRDRSLTLNRSLAILQRSKSLSALYRGPNRGPESP